MAYTKSSFPSFVQAGWQQSIQFDTIKAYKGIHI